MIPPTGNGAYFFAFTCNAIHDMLDTCRTEKKKGSTSPVLPRRNPAQASRNYKVVMMLTHPSRHL
jgi:hypothetical protein